MRRAFTLLLALSACATSQTSARDPSRLLVGTWNNSAQMASVPESLKRPPVAGGAYEWVDFQHARFFSVDVPALTSDSSKALYLVWRANGPDGPVSRQRLWVFRTLSSGAKVMDFYAFKDGKAFETLTNDTGAFKAVTLDNLTAYGPQCSLPVVPNAQGWTAAIPPTCAITARSGRKMVLSANIDVTRDRFTYSEQGTLESGALAFKVPGGPAYDFVRLGR
jgi:hypothetical protein